MIEEAWNRLPMILQFLIAAPLTLLALMIFLYVVFRPILFLIDLVTGKVRITIERNQEDTIE